MPTLRYAGSSSITSSTVSGLRIREVQHTGDVEKIVIPSHEIAIVHNARESREVWDGKRLPSRIWAKGDIAFLPKRTELSATLAPGNYSETLIELDENLFERVSAGLIDYRRVDFRYADVSGPVITGIAHSIQQIALDEDAQRWPLLVYSASVALATALIRQLSPAASTVIDATKSGLTIERKRRLLEYIDAHLAEPITLDELAAIAAMSPYHLIRSFKTEMGVTPFRWVLLQRIERARRLLEITALPLAEIAYACGFSSQSHFSTVFKQATGATPAGYRRQRAA